VSNLTDFLHKLVHTIGASSLHEDVDKLAEDEGKTAVEDVTKDVEKEVNPDAAE
jgi:hypothetical protein